MSDETKVLAQAIKLNAEANLDLVTELRSGRLIMQQMATTLVQIHESQKQILEEMQNAQSQIRESNGKIRLLREDFTRLETRVTEIEQSPARRSAGAG